MKLSTWIAISWALTIGCYLIVSISVGEEMFNATGKFDPFTWWLIVTLNMMLGAGLAIMMFITMSYNKLDKED